MEEKNENVVEETTQDNVTKVNISDTQEGDNITRVNLDNPPKKEEDATEKQSTDEVPVRDGSEASEEVREENKEKLEELTEQSELIDQRLNKKPPKNFESSGNDILGGGFSLGRFDPR